MCCGRVQYGECYFEVQKDRADELLESRKEKISQEVADLEAQVGAIQETLGSLKKQLYGRFGGNINLEEQ
jgi:prefoldin subunit 4